MIAAGWIVYALVYGGVRLVRHRRRSLVAIFLVYGVYFGLTEGVEKAWIADLAPASTRGIGVRRLQRRARRRRPRGEPAVRCHLDARVATSGVLHRRGVRSRRDRAAILDVSPEGISRCCPRLYSNRSMKQILVTNDDGVRSEGIHALAQRSRAPRRRHRRRAAHRGQRHRPRAHAAASAAHGAARRRRLRGRRHADRLRQHRDHADLQAARRPTSIVLRHQQGLQPRRRRDVFGDRGGRAGGRAARHSEHRGLARAVAEHLRLRPLPRRRRAVAAIVLRAGLPPRTFLNINVPRGQPKGFA